MRHRACLLAAALALLPGWAAAHDTWFEKQPGEAGAPRLALGTGNRFPVQESGIAATYLVASGCRGEHGAATLTPRGDAATALLLEPPPGARTCWAQSEPFELTLGAEQIPVYLQEIQAGPEIRAAWAAMAQRGLPWRERYAKHARIELGAPAAQVVPMAMDLLIEHEGPLRAGQTVRVRVLRDGQPLAGLAVELVGEVSAFGIWRRSDAEGRVQVPVPTAGRWLLRATDLRLSPEADRWDSRFVTLAFDAAPAATQNGISLSSNARSASHTAASTAMSSDPPSSTTRR